LVSNLGSSCLSNWSMALSPSDFMHILLWIEMQFWQKWRAHFLFFFECVIKWL
jgi:hypothetical protein